MEDQAIELPPALAAAIAPTIANRYLVAGNYPAPARFVRQIEKARARLDLEPLDGLDEPTLALNMGTGGGQTNIGNDTSAAEGTPNDF